MKSFFPALALSAIVLLTGCSSSTQASGNPEPEPAPEPAEITSSPGTQTWNATVIKNKFFSTQPEDCSDVQVHGGAGDYTTFIECENTETYLWLFSDAEKRDAYLPEILELGLPLLVSEDWVIASPLDLEAAQEEIGGAVNRL